MVARVAAKGFRWGGWVERAEGNEASVSRESEVLRQSGLTPPCARLLGMRAAISWGDVEESVECRSGSTLSFRVLPRVPSRRS